jgi:hypothetical protein
MKGKGIGNDHAVPSLPEAARQLEALGKPSEGKQNIHDRLGKRNKPGVAHRLR